MSARTFNLPDLGEGLTDGEAVSWEVQVGDTVAIDQVIAVVETAKAQVDLPCPFAGTVATLHAEAGQTVDVGRPLITVEVTDGEEAGASALVGGGTDRSERTEERMAEARRVGKRALRVRHVRRTAGPSPSGRATAGGGRLRTD